METVEPVRPDPAGGERFPRRDLAVRLGWAGLSLLFVSSFPGLLRFFRPLPGRAAAGRVDVGALQDLRAPAVVTRWVGRHGLWVVNRDGRIFALQARCTHLGCTPRWEHDRDVFRCPCHGSRFSPEGEVLNGPAMRPLVRLAVRVEHDRVLVDPSRRAPLDRAERDPAFYVAV